LPAKAPVCSVTPVVKTLPVLGALLFGLAIYALLPQGIIALNDDFGYLRSVVATLQHGRPWTDDWLEPWSAGLSVLSAGLFAGTGSFTFATYGLLAMAAAGSFYLAHRLLTARGVPAGRAFLLTTLGLLFPTVLWKEVQFTGMALYLPCLLGALWAAESRKWGWFFLAWTLAFSTRQSALVWGILPVAALVSDARQGSNGASRAWLGPVLVAVLGGALFLAIGAGMNKTVAQQLITDRMGASWQPGAAARAALTGGVAALLAAGWGAAAMGLTQFSLARNRAWRWPVAIAAAAVLLIVNARDYVAVEFDTFDAVWGTISLRLLLVVGAAGLALGRFAWRPLPAAAALAAVGALSFRTTVWDYYLVEAGVFGFFSIRPRRPEPGAARPAGHWLWAAAGGVLALCELVSAVQTKATLDRTHALFALGSRAIEGGRVAPNQASFLPWGLMAWYYFPLHVTKVGGDPGELGEFGRYLDQDAVLVAWRYSRPLRRLPGHDGGLPEDRAAVILSGKFNYCWLYGMEVELVSGPRENVRAARSPYPADYRPPTFPSSDAGWRALISERKLAVP
jgi:hypothetical protein